ALDSIALDQLRNSGTGYAENGDAIFRCANSGDARVQFVFMPAPFNNVHGGNNHRLRAEAHESICHSRVAQIVADTNTDFAPWGVPQFLFFGGETVFEELNRYALAALEDDVPIRADDERSVVEISRGQWIFAASDEIALMRLAPGLD